MFLLVRNILKMFFYKKFTTKKIVQNEPIFNAAPAAFKNNARFKNGQNWPKNNHLASLI